MTKHLKPILNTSLPRAFRCIRLELARESMHPEGDTGIAYLIVAPLDSDDRIDVELWKQHREACRVVRIRPGQLEHLGHLVHRPGGSWAFKYDVNEDTADEVGYHLSDAQFVPGKYVSVRERDAMHTYQVTLATPL